MPDNSTLIPSSNVSSPHPVSPSAVLDDDIEQALSPHVYLTLKIVGIVFFLLMSGLISGLHLALMSLDLIELRCMQIAGTEKEKKQAKKILPIREKTNYLLTALILAVVACDSATTLLIGSLTENVWALFLSTILITIFAGILPEAVVFKYSSVVAAKTIYITYLILILTFPLAYPISLGLDSCIKHHGPVRNRKYLSAYIDMIKRETHLEPFEIATLQGTLSLNSKNVRQIMTPIEKVISLPETTILGWEMFVNILKTGYSRIPIYRNNDKSYIVGLLHIKEIATVFGFNSNIKVPVKFIMEKAPRPLNFVSADSPLSRNNFINSLKTGIHLAFVVEGPVAVSTKRQVIGIVTLEDMIEAVTGQQISDESDVSPATDSRKDRKKGMLYAQQILKALQEEGKYPRKFSHPL